MSACSSLSTACGSSKETVILHFGLGWLIGLLIVVYIIGLVAANLLIAIAYMDATPPWYVKIVPLFWPVALPLWVAYILVRILPMPFWK